MEQHKHYRLVKCIIDKELKNILLKSKPINQRYGRMDELPT
jgi:hypothetical protein